MRSFWDSLKHIKFRAPAQSVRVLTFIIVMILVLSDLMVSPWYWGDHSGTLQMIICLSAAISSIFLLFKSPLSVWAFGATLLAGTFLDSGSAETALNIVLLYGGAVSYSASYRQNLFLLVLLLGFYLPRSWSSSPIDIILAAVFGLGLSYILPTSIRWLVNYQISQEAIYQAHTIEGQLRLEQNRKELARELHDVVARELTIMALHSSMARDSTDETLRNNTFDLVGDQARSTLHELRRLVKTLRTDDDSSMAPQLYSANIDLSLTLEQVIHNFKMANFPVEIDIQGDLSRIPDSIKPTVERSLKELEINAMKHGISSSPATLTVRVEQQRLLLYSVNTVRQSPPKEHLGLGYGLAGLRERVKLLGGKLESGTHGNRWSTEITIPF